MLRRDLAQGLTQVVSSNGPGNTANDVAANGDVVYWESLAIYRYRHGVVTRLTTPEPATWHAAPLTDGSNVVYKVIGQTRHAIQAYFSPIMSTTLAANRTSRPEPRFDYLVTNGWIAYTDAGSQGQLHPWTRSPSGERWQLSFFASSSQLAALNPHGDVVLRQGDRFYLAPAAGSTLLDVASSLPTSFRWLDGSWYVIMGPHLMRVNLDE